MHSLIYVSRRTAEPDQLAREVDEILHVSRLRNAALAVTGALIATPLTFAQMLEGPQAALAELLASIYKDPRHDMIHLVDLAPKDERDFAGWSLAYHGESSYVSAMLAEAIAAPDFDLARQVDRIRALMLKFA